jgi:hypothetical protein
MDHDNKRERYLSVIVAVNFTVIAGYCAFGAPPAPGGLKQIVGGSVMAMIAWLWCAYSWQRARSSGIVSARITGRLTEDDERNNEGHSQDGANHDSDEESQSEG